MLHKEHHCAPVTSDMRSKELCAIALLGAVGAKIHFIFFPVVPNL
jgi:hypothetical protein